MFLKLLCLQKIQTRRISLVGDLVHHMLFPDGRKNSHAACHDLHIKSSSKVNKLLFPFPTDTL